jgi:hypothetical protein
MTFNLVHTLKVVIISKSALQPGRGMLPRPRRFELVGPDIAKTFGTRLQTPSRLGIFQIKHG